MYMFFHCIHILQFFPFLMKNSKNRTKISVLAIYHKECVKEKGFNSPECRSYAPDLSGVVIMLSAEPIAPSFSITTLNHIP